MEMENAVDDADGTELRRRRDASAIVAAAVAAAAAAVNSSANAVATTSSLSPTSSSSVVGVVTGHKTHTCLQCNASFSERDELERHELTHSPTAQVVLKRRLESSNKY